MANGTKDFEMGRECDSKMLDMFLNSLKQIDVEHLKAYMFITLNEVGFGSNVTSFAGTEKDVLFMLAQLCVNNPKLHKYFHPEIVKLAEIIKKNSEQVIFRNENV